MRRSAPERSPLRMCRDVRYLAVAAEGLMASHFRFRLVITLTLSALLGIAACATGTDTNVFTACGDIEQHARNCNVAEVSFPSDCPDTPEIKCYAHCYLAASCAALSGRDAAK